MKTATMAWAKIAEAAASAGTDGAATLGPVVADRIARIRARLDEGRYPLDIDTLAGALVAVQDRERMAAGMGRAAGSSLSAAVAAQLAATMRRMDGGAMLVLQLEFVEQLRGAEIAAVFGTDPAAIGAVRRSALCELSGRLLES